MNPSINPQKADVSEIDSMYRSVHAIMRWWVGEAHVPFCMAALIPCGSRWHILARSHHILSELPTQTKQFQEQVSETRLRLATPSSDSIARANIELLVVLTQKKKRRRKKRIRSREWESERALDEVRSESRAMDACERYAVSKDLGSRMRSWSSPPNSLLLGMESRTGGGLDFRDRAASRVDGSLTR